MERVPVILSETASLSAVNEPLKRSSRIKYTCFGVSQNYLVFGASSGGLYIFQREPCSFIQLLPSNIGSLTHVSMSPCESFVAFSSVKGFICIVGYQSTSAPRFRRTSTEHEGSIITALQWSARSSELYIGDNTGRISVLGLLFYMLSHVTLMQLDSRIVQLDWHYHLLLVSTLSRSYLCDTVHEQYRQIGSQLRDGAFGACFYNLGDEDYAVTDYDRETTRYSTPFSSLREGERLLSDDRLRNVKIYCARPGVRLWEVRIDGTVLNTLQLKRAFAMPPTPVIRLNNSSGNSDSLNNAKSHEPFSFSKLCRAVDNQYLLAFHSSGLYLLDPGVNDAVIWSDSITGITDVQTVGDILYLWCDHAKLRALTVCKLDTFVIRLYLQNMFEVCATLVADHRNYIAAMIKESPKWQFLPELAKRIEENGLVVPEEVSTALSSLAQEVLLIQQKQTALKLNSGIFLVGNDFSLHYSAPQPKAQTYSYRDALLKTQTDSNRLNGHAKDFSLRIECETRTSSRDSSDVESGADDLDDVFQLLGITKQEMKIALKEMGTTITGTLTSSTKSVRQSLWIMMRKQKLLWASNDWTTSSLGREKLTSNGRRNSMEDGMETPNTRISNLIRACENVSNYKSGGKGHEDYVFDLLESFVLVCYQYGALSFDEVNSIIMGRTREPDCENIKISRIFNEWLKREENKIFLFSQIFSEDISTQIRIHLHNSIKSGMLVLWIRKNLPKVRGNASLYPGFMRNLYNENEFLVDRILSQFLNITASLLDPFIILQCLSVCKSPCIFLSWNRVLELCQEGKLHRDRSTLEGLAKDDWPLPVTLNAILIMLDLKQVDYCRSAPIKDIFYTILRLETRGLKNGKSELSVFEECGTLYLEYLATLPSPKISECLDDIEIRTYLLLLFEQMKCFQSDYKCCPCGFPVPLSSDQLIGHKLPHIKVCRSLVLWLNQNNKEKLDRLCQTNPLLWSLVLSVRRADPLEPVLPTILQMGDFLELEHRSEEMSDEIWSKVFRLCHGLDKNECLGCSRPLTDPRKPPGESDQHHQLWKRLFEFLLRKTGPAEAIRLLSKHADLVPQGAIDKRFLQMCAISTLIDPTSGLLSRFALDEISYVPRKIPNVSAFSHTLVEHLEKAGFSTEMLPSSTAKPTSKHHWGVKINLDKATCPCCLLPLGSSVPVEKGGVAVFKCAHVFHTVCLHKRSSLLKNSGCPICPKRML